MTNRIRTTLALLAVLAMAPMAEARTLDRIACVVDDKVITLSEVEERVAVLRTQAPTASRDFLMREATQALIAEKLFEKAMGELAIDVGPSELQIAIQDVMKQNGFASEEQLAEAVERSGIGWDEYRSSMRKQLSQMKLLNLKVRSQVKVSEDEIKRRYGEMAALEKGEDEVHASHLLVHVADGSPVEQLEAARAIAVELANKARAGADFDSLAAEGVPAGARIDGGDLGWFKRGELVPELERAAFGLQAGGISDPVQTRFGWHVVQVKERRKTAARSFAEVADQLRERLYREEMERQTQRYVDELKREAVISYAVSELAPAAPPATPVTPAAAASQGSQDKK